MFKNRFLLMALLISLCATAAMAVRLEEDGLLVMEAERDYTLVPGDGSREITFEFFNETAGYSGTGYLRSMPPGTNLYVDITRTDRLDFTGKFSTPGTYYIWVRVRAAADENSLHIGTPDEGIIDENVDVRPFNQWLWVGGTEVQVPIAGLFTISIFPRESGCIIDQVLMTNDDSFTPTGTYDESPDDAAGKTALPSPAAEATDVVRDVELSWSTGEFAVTHNVYLGLDFDDVNNADENSALLVGPDLSGTTFTPDDLLLFGETYYWRVDAVNDVGLDSPWKGEVWSFEVEPYAYPLENVTATASSSTTAKGMTPDKTVDGSGMTSDEHSMDEDTMWLSAPAATLPAWIQYEFDDVYKLSELWVWNSNQAVEGFIGFGAREVTVEYSLDGVEWSSLGDVEFAQAPGDVGYTHNTEVDLAGVQAKFVRLTIASNWKGVVPQVGLSEVRFYYVPVKAREPRPDNGASGVDPDVLLGWRSGRMAFSHTLTLSTNPETVVETTDSTYDTTALDLQLGESYSWVVTEVNEAAIPSEWEGDVWAFTVAEPWVFDDMESYLDKDSFWIWETWLDGTEYGTNDPDNGSLVGADPGRGEWGVATGLGRSQSLPIWFDNAAVSYSEATRFVDNEDWTGHGIDSLSLYFRKGSDNTGGGQVYVKINDKEVVYEDPADVPPGWQTDQWVHWIIDLSTVGADLTRVTKMMVGVQGANAKGVLYVDDIAFYKTPPASEQVVSWFEAESGTRGPTMMLFDDLGGSLGASGGKFIGTENGSGQDTGVVQLDGIATYSFSVDQPGVYRLRARVGDFGGNSFHVRIPGSVFNTNGFQDGWIAWNFDAPDELAWRTLADYNDGDQEVEFTLSAGQHTLEIARREDGAFLDAIAIVSVTE